MKFKISYKKDYEIDEDIFVEANFVDHVECSVREAVEIAEDLVRNGYFDIVVTVDE